MRKFSGNQRDKFRFIEECEQKLTLLLYLYNHYALAHKYEEAMRRIDEYFQRRGTDKKSAVTENINKRRITKSNVTLLFGVYNVLLS